MAFSHSVVKLPVFGVKWQSYTLTSRFLPIRVKPKTNSLYTVFNLMRALCLMAMDIILLLTLAIFIYYSIAWCLIEPYERGFYCSDQSIRNPFYVNTIPSSILLLITLALPLLIILIANALPVFFGSQMSNGKTNASHSLDNAIQTSTYIYLDYIFGFFILTLLLDIVKCCVGRLRPNFILMCKPDDMSICDVNSLAYVANVNCTSSWKEARNSRMSFPSGHSAASTFFLIFIFYYLNQVYRQSLTYTVNVFRLFTITAAALFTVYCCITRITDFWHFSTDVAGGVIFAVVIFYLLQKSANYINK